ncbi:MAG: RHS repeat-associated core domain-containing protein [Actinomycetota bacterium]
MTRTEGGGSTEEFLYAYDVHGSTSLLVNETPNQFGAAGRAAASYAYGPYGERDDAISKQDDSTTNPVNPYRYSGRRFDSGSETYDMGARRFATGAMRFLQQDFLSFALGDLSLTLDPLTQNRFSLAGGNPVSFVEWDGHRLARGGGGGSGSSPSPSENPEATRATSFSPAGQSGYQPLVSADSTQPVLWQTLDRGEIGFWSVRIEARGSVQQGIEDYLLSARLEGFSLVLASGGQEIKRDLEILPETLSRGVILKESASGLGAAVARESFAFAPIEEIGPPGFTPQARGRTEYRTCCRNPGTTTITTTITNVPGVSERGGLSYELRVTVAPLHLSPDTRPAIPDPQTSSQSYRRLFAAAARLAPGPLWLPPSQAVSADQYWPPRFG